MANPWDELVMHAKACHDAMGGAVVSLTATPYKVHINNVGQVFVYKDDGVPVHAKISTTRYSPDVQQCPPVPDEQQAADPYAELKDALAAGKAIQVDIGGSHWGDCLRPEWLCPPDCYRAKPEEPATTAPAQDAIASPAEADDGPVTVLSVLACAASHMAARAATYDSPGGERSMGKAVEAFNAIDRPAEASASDSETGQHAPGVKLDHGKPRAGLVLGGFARALTAVSDVGTFGAKKYTPHGWRSVPHGFDRYTDAMVRHQLAEAVGEQFDAESGLSHAAHAAWNALARLELMLSRRTQLITCALPAEAKAREAAKRA